MAAKKYTYKVTGAAAVLRTVDGSERYFYQGAMVPEGFDPESIKHAIAVGLVSRIEVVDLAATAAAAKAAAEAKAKSEADAKAKADADAKAAEEKAKAEEGAAAKAAAAKGK